MRRLAEEFGPEWAMEHIVPQVSPAVAFKPSEKWINKIDMRVMSHSEIEFSCLHSIITMGDKVMVLF